MVDSLEIERDSVLGMQISYLEEIEKFYPFISPNFYLFLSVYVLPAGPFARFHGQLPPTCMKVQQLTLGTTSPRLRTRGGPSHSQQEKRPFGIYIAIQEVPNLHGDDLAKLQTSKVFKIFF